MTVKWSDVKNSESYKSLSPDEQAKTKQLYYSNVIAKSPSFNSIGPEEQKKASDLFFAAETPIVPQKKQYGWAEAAKTGLYNGAKTLTDTVLHPIDSLKKLGGVIGAGLTPQNLTVPGAAITTAEYMAGAALNSLPAETRASFISQHPQLLQMMADKASRLGGYFSDRYGSIDNIKRSIANNPFSTGADFLTLLSGGEGAARFAGAKGLATGIGAARDFVNPLSTDNALGLAVKGGAKAVGLPLPTRNDLIRMAGVAKNPEANVMTKATEGQPSEVMNALRNPPDYVPGNASNAARAVVDKLDNSSFAAMQKTADNTTDFATSSDATNKANEVADVAHVQSIGGPVDLQTLEGIRKINKAEKYAVVDQGSAPIDNNLRHLFLRPSMQKVLAKAQQLAAEQGGAMQDPWANKVSAPSVPSANTVNSSLGAQTPYVSSLDRLLGTAGKVLSEPGPVNPPQGLTPANNLNASLGAQNLTTSSLSKLLGGAGNIVDDSKSVTSAAGSANPSRKAPVANESIPVTPTQGVSGNYNQNFFGPSPTITGPEAHSMKLMMDDLANDPDIKKQFGIGANELSAIRDTRSGLLGWIEDNIPGYKEAREQYAIDSNAIDRKKFGNYLSARLKESPDSFLASLDDPTDALGNVNTVRHTTGEVRGRSINDFLPPEEQAVLSNVENNIRLKKETDRQGSLGNVFADKISNAASNGPLGMLVKTPVLGSILKPALSAADSRIESRLSNAMQTPASAANAVQNAMTWDKRVGTAQEATKGVANALADYPAAFNALTSDQDNQQPNPNQPRGTVTQAYPSDVPAMPTDAPEDQSAPVDETSDPDVQTAVQPRMTEQTEPEPQSTNALSPFLQPEFQDNVLARMRQAMAPQATPGPEQEDNVLARPLSPGQQGPGPRQAGPVAPRQMDPTGGGAPIPGATSNPVHIGNEQWHLPIAHASAITGVPVQIIDAVMKQESNGNKNARSPVGAIGLMQLMPGTAEGLGVDPNNPEQNILGGARYLAQQYKKFGNWDAALAAYNAGPGAVESHGGKIPPYAETQNYVKRIKADIQHRYGGIK